MTLELTPRRREILDAAVTVLARQGARGLTHRAVDRQAGLAEGSTSAYFRSRQALETALAEHVARRLEVDVETLGRSLATRPGDHEHTVTQTSGLFAEWLSHPELLTARLELTVAATRDADFSRRFLAWRGDLVAVVDRVLTNSGREFAISADTLVDAFDGVLLASLLLPAQQRPDYVRQCIDQLLTAVEPWPRPR